MTVHTNYKMKSPTPAELRAVRGQRTQSQIAELLGKSLRTYQKWEAPVTANNSHKMDGALFELLLIKLAQTK